MKRYVKDPNDAVDYQINWSPFLGVDTIIASTWTPDDGITVASDGRSATTTTVTVAGGTVGQEFGVRNRITTTAGRIWDETLYFLIVDR